MEKRLKILVLVVMGMLSVGKGWGQPVTAQVTGTYSYAAGAVTVGSVSGFTAPQQAYWYSAVQYPTPGTDPNGETVLVYLTDAGTKQMFLVRGYAGSTASAKAAGSLVSFRIATVTLTPTITQTPTAVPNINIILMPTRFIEGSYPYLTETPTFTSTITDTPTVTLTFTPTPTLYFQTPTPTDTPINTPTSTPTLTPTSTPTSTVTQTPTPTPT